MEWNLMTLKLKVTLQTFLYTAWSLNTGPSLYPLEDPLLGCAGLCPTSLHLEKAFNHFSKEVLWEVLLEFGVSGPLLQTLQSPYTLCCRWMLESTRVTSCHYLHDLHGQTSWRRKGVAMGWWVSGLLVSWPCFLQMMWFERCPLWRGWH